MIMPGVWTIAALALLATDPAYRTLTRRVDHLPDPYEPYREMIANGAHVDFELSGHVRFREKQPYPRDRLGDAVALDEDQARDLNTFLAIALHSPEPIEINGFADPHECAASACMELSRQRALMIHRLLLFKRVPATRVARICWFGSGEILTDDPSQEERARNRRVEVHFASSSPKGTCLSD